TGKVGVCIATSGPGATNLVTGLANAYMDSIPMVAITGQVPTSQIGTDAFQEVDITGVTLPLTKHNYLVKDAQKLPEIIKNAFYIASSGRPGPVLVDLPKDVASTVIDFNGEWKAVQLQGYKPTYKGHPGKIEEAAALLSSAQRPMIYAGGGVLTSHASAELLQLAELLSAPVANSFMGIPSFPCDHPLFMGMLGLHGTHYANLAVSRCDVLLALGARFADRVTGRIDGFAPEAKIIHIDVDPAEIGKNVRIDVPIVGDVKMVLESLLKKLKKKEVPANNGWISKIKEWKRKHPLHYQQESGRILPQAVIEGISQATDGQAFVATDVGQHQMWVAHFYQFKRTGGLISSGGLGTMGFGLPAAIGVQMGNPEAPVVLVTGDGSIQMNIQELATMVEQKLPVKIFILNNQTLGMVRQLQEFYCEKRYIAVNFDFDPDFAILAKAYGIDSYTVKTQAELKAVLPEVMAGPGAAGGNCLVDPEE
ncbi:MAG: biosynthetic-type acetolactate synthase large subunit, partial [Clostridia bacterium]|nr:biosynthetic-type acetolactate synthase large subunit [Clostridia bacterium]